jgi:hypothetical protein
VPAERVGVLLCSEYSGRVKAIDLATGAVVGRQFDSQQGIVGDLLISPDGATLLEAIAKTPVYVQWRLDGGGPVSSAMAETDTAVDVTYLDERLLIVTDDSGEAIGASDLRIINADNGEALDPLAGITMAVPMSDGRLAAVFSDGTVVTYDVDRQARTGRSADVGFAPEGITTVGQRALIWAGGRLQGVDLDRGALVDPAVEQEAAINLAVAPDSSHMLTLDGFYRLLQRRDADTGEPVGGDHRLRTAHRGRRHRGGQHVRRPTRGSRSWLADGSWSASSTHHWSGECNGASRRRPAGWRCSARTEPCASTMSLRGLSSATRFPSQEKAVR